MSVELSVGGEITLQYMGPAPWHSSNHSFMFLLLLSLQKITIIRTNIVFLL